MLFHECQGSLPVLQILYMAQLIDLVKADGLDVDELCQIGQIGLGGSHHAHTGTGEGDLGGGGKLVDHVSIAVLLAQREDVGELHIVTGKLVDAISVIPHQHEVGSGGLHLCNTLNGLIGIHHALGVGVLGHVPHTFDFGILHQFLHHVHIGTGGGHGHGDHLHAEALGDLKVAVIAGCRADPLHLIELCPGLLAVEHTVGKCLGHGIIHQLQAGIAAHENLRGLAAQDLGK